MKRSELRLDHPDFNPGPTWHPLTPEDPIDRAFLNVSIALVATIVGGFALVGVIATGLLLVSKSWCA